MISDGSSPESSSSMLRADVMKTRRLSLKVVVVEQALYDRPGPGVGRRQRRHGDESRPLGLLFQSLRPALSPKHRKPPCR